MDHPLLANANRALRQRVIQHLSNGCMVRRAGDFVFVCGGTGTNENTGKPYLRAQFSEFCAHAAPDLKLIRPEHAFPNYNYELAGAAFDLGKFEETIASLSHVIVLFPEAPGSFAEVGLFSRVKNFYEKTILVLNGEYQGKGGFINLGPARQFSEGSEFGIPIHTSYNEPDFQIVLDRIRERPVSPYMKTFSPDRPSRLKAHEQIAFVYKIVDLLSAATEDDILFLMHAVFKGSSSKKIIREMLSILYGAGYIERTGIFGHYRCNGSVLDFMPARDGARGDENEIRLELAAAYQDALPEFQSIVEQADAA